MFYTFPVSFTKHSSFQFVIVLIDITFRQWRRQNILDNTISQWQTRHNIIDNTIIQWIRQNIVNSYFIEFCPPFYWISEYCLHTIHLKLCFIRFQSMLPNTVFISICDSSHTQHNYSIDKTKYNRQSKYLNE